MSSESAEKKALRSCYDSLVKLPDPDSVAGVLFARGKITAPVLEEIQEAPTKTKKGQKVANSIMARVSVDPSEFDDFVSILREEPVNSSIVQKLEAALNPQPGNPGGSGTTGGRGSSSVPVAPPPSRSVAPPPPRPVEQFIERIPPENRGKKVKELYEVAQIAKEMVQWENVAPYLGLKEGDVEAVKQDCRGLEEKKKAVIQKWKNSQGPFATYEALIKIFHSCGEIGMVEQLCKMLGADFS